MELTRFCWTLWAWGTEIFLGSQNMLSLFQCFQKVCKPTQVSYEQENNDMRDQNHRTEVEMGENCNWNILKKGVARLGSLRARRTTCTRKSKFTASWKWELQKTDGVLLGWLFILPARRAVHGGSNLPTVSQPIRGKGETVNDFTAPPHTHTPIHTHTHNLTHSYTHTHPWVPTAPCTSGHWDGPGIENSPGLSEERVLEKANTAPEFMSEASQIISRTGANHSMSS